MVLLVGSVSATFTYYQDFESDTEGYVNIGAGRTTDQANSGSYSLNSGATGNNFVILNITEYTNASGKWVVEMYLYETATGDESGYFSYNENYIYGTTTGLDSYAYTRSDSCSSGQEEWQYYSACVDTNIPNYKNAWYGFRVMVDNTASPSTITINTDDGTADGSPFSYGSPTDVYFINLKSTGNMYIDDVKIWDYDVYGWTSPALLFDDINLSSPSPSNDTGFATDVIDFTLYMNNTYYSVCYLYVNDTLLASNGFAGGVNNLVTLTSTPGVLADGMHDYYFYCNQSNDTTQNETTVTNLFYIDTTNPLEVFSLNDGFDVNINQSYQINYSDNLLLWSFNVSIDDVLQYNLSNVGSNFYSYNGSIYGLNYSLGVHNITSTVCDGHTALAIGEYKDIHTEGDKLIFKENVYVESLKNIYSFDYVKQKDRYSFSFIYSEAQTEVSFKLPPECTYINNKAYKGWFVCGDSTWVDFEGDYDIKVNGNIVTATASKPTKIFNFNSVGDLNCVTTTYNWNNRANLNISAYSGVTGDLITAFDIYVNGTLSGSTTDGVFSVTNLSESDYEITFVNSSYETATTVISIDNITEYYNFTVYGANSLNISIYDEATDEPINTTFINILFASISDSWVNSTNTSKLYIEGLEVGTYQLTFYNDNYSTRVYFITVGNLTHQNLDAYMTDSTTSTIFTTYDGGTGAVLDNATYSIYKQIAGVWALVETKSTDISGKIKFYYEALGNYMFTVFKTDYETKIFYLNPVLSTEYDVTLDKVSIQDLYWDYSDVNIIYTTSFAEGLNTFTFLISSPIGTLTDYYYNISYPSAYNTSTGINAIGEALTSTLNITNPQITDRVKLEYYYTSSIYGTRNFTIYMLIDSNYSDSNNTFMKNKQTTYGMGLIERLLVATMLVLAVVGVCSLIGSAVLGMILGLFVFGYFSYIGFIPLWSIALAVTLGVIIISLGAKQ